MTFGKGDHLPHRKRAAPPKARGRRSKELRKLAKQARAQVQQAREDNKSEPRDEDDEDDEDDDEDDSSDEFDEDDDDDDDDDDDYQDSEAFGGKQQALTMEQRKSFGMDVLTQEELRIAIKVLYMWKYESPAESEWKPIITELKSEIGVSRNSIKKVFKGCRDGRANPEKKQKGGGRKPKLAEDNAGLIAGVAALNGSASPRMATQICNAENPPELRVCRNTFMNTIKIYTDHEEVAILRRKTGSKDPESDWAKARVTIATQMLAQIKLGRDIDANNSLLEPTFEDVEKKSTQPPIFPDGVIFCDKNHSVASLGGAGHKGSFGRRQNRIAVHPKTGRLLRLASGGVMPKRKFRVVAKYTTEARGCYGVCCPVIDGIEHGQFIETFDYTEKKLLSIKAYKIQMEKEMSYRRNMKSQGWKDYVSASPYLDWYGKENWKTHLQDAPAMRKYK